jgi:hypothetical protein
MPVRIILGSDSEVLRKKHAEILELFPAANAQEIRVARMFATAALAGELAAIHKLVDWQAATSGDYSDSDSVNTAVALFNQWRQSRETNAAFGTEHSSIMQAERSVTDGQLRRGGQAQALSCPSSSRQDWVLSR